MGNNCNSHEERVANALESIARDLRTLARPSIMNVPANFKDVENHPKIKKFNWKDLFRFQNK